MQQIIKPNLKIIMEEILIPISMFMLIFGIVYLYLSTRNRERLALIEKGVEASIFMRGRDSSGNSPFWKIFILNISLLLMGIGTGVFIALLLTTFTKLNSDGVYPACIFLMAGVGLFVGYNMTKKLDKAPTE